MDKKFNPHDIVTDGTFTGRIYKTLALDTVEPIYDVVFEGGHAVRCERELTMIRKHVASDKSFSEQCAEWLVTS
jgi:hypothetical protein